MDRRVAEMGGPVDHEFDEIDRRLEEVDQQLEGCRQAMLLSRAAIVVAALVLSLVTTIATAYLTPIVVIAAIAALIGGTVWLGANKSTREGLDAERADLEAAKTRLFDQVAAHNGWRDMTPTVH